MLLLFLQTLIIFQSKERGEASRSFIEEFLCSEIFSETRCSLSLSVSVQANILSSSCGRAALVSLRVSTRGTHISWNDAFMSAGLCPGGCGHAPSRKASHHRPLKRVRCGRDPGQTCSYTDQIRVPTEPRAKHKTPKFSKVWNGIFWQIQILSAWTCLLWNVFKYWKCFIMFAEAKTSWMLTQKILQRLLWKVSAVFLSIFVFSCEQGLWCAFFYVQNVKNIPVLLLQNTAGVLVRASQLADMHENVSDY